MSGNNTRQYGELIKIGTPVIIGQLGTIVLGFADTLMIGHHSTNELAAAGLVNNVFALVLLFYLGFSYGLTPIVGQLYGVDRKEEIGSKLKNAIPANLLTGLLLMTLMTVLYFNLAHIGQPSELLPQIRPYFIVNLVSLPFVGVFNTLKQFFDGTTRTGVPMWVMIGGNLFNILFNWLLIYGKGGFPEMGLLGAGIATMASRILMALSLCAILFWAKSNRVYRLGMSNARINKADFREMNRMGFPVALLMGMETAAFSLSSVMAGWLGTLSLAAHQVMITTSQLFYLILLGMAAAVSIRISLFTGQKNYAAVRRTAADGFRLNLMVSFAMSIPLLIFRNHIGTFFTDSAEVANMVAGLCIVLVVYQFGDGLQCIFANALRGIACVKPMVLYAFLAYFVINLPLGYFMGFTLKLGITGIWAAFPFGLSAAGLLYWLRFRRELKKMEAGANAA